MSTEGDHPGEGGTRPFADVLERLRRDGCCLLITGEVPESVGVHVTRRLLGAPESDRKRVVALTNSAAKSLESRLPYGVGTAEPTLWTVDQRYGQRSAARPGSADPPAASDAVDDLRWLQAELTEAIEWFDERADGLDPAELRVAVDSLAYLLEAHDRTTVRRFVRETGERVRAVNGMAHYHLAVPDADPAVAELSELFDARVELRQRDGGLPEQRWHVPAASFRSEWIRI